MDALTARFEAIRGSARMARLSDREAECHRALIQPSGDLHDDHLSFTDRTAAHDDPGFTGRSLLQHRDWLAHLPCPVLDLDSAAPVAELVKAVAAWTP